MPSSELTYFYAVSADKAWLDDVNSRGFTESQVSRQWVEIIKHPSAELWAAVIPETYLARLDEILNEDELAEVTSGLKTKEQMIAEGWNL